MQPTKRLSEAQRQRKIPNNNNSHKENDMFRKTFVAASLILVLVVALGRRSASAQDAEAAKSEAEKAVSAYRLDFSVDEMEDGKKINTRLYSMNLNSDSSNELKIGTRVPVDTKQGEFQYIDLGTNIWSRLEDRKGLINLTVRAEISNFAIPEQSLGHESRPIIRQLKISASTLALLGKPMEVGSVDDPNSRRKFQLEVTVTKLR
jgi:hypothetical protein